MTPAAPRALTAALVTGALVVAAAATACGGSSHPRRAALPAGPQQMTATVDAVRLGVSGGCARNRVGGGLTDGRVVLTSASLVAGAGTVQVTNAQGKQVAGRVVALDADTDVAWVYAPGLPSVRIGPALQSDRVVPAYLFTFTAAGTPVTYRAQTLERTTLTTQDVFGTHPVRRDIYRLHLDSAASVPVSGAPVLDSSGNLLGIATATAPGDSHSVDVVAGDAVARSAATRSLSAQDPATMATSAGTRCAAAVSVSS
ncbi:MAG TPA: serine protease, partial [Mycobacteriales bacterium]|nr:serine protease [Mycobacteriales bacterium]